MTNFAETPMTDLKIEENLTLARFPEVFQGDEYSEGEYSAEPVKNILKNVVPLQNRIEGMTPDMDHIEHPAHYMLHSGAIGVMYFHIGELLKDINFFREAIMFLENSLKAYEYLLKKEGSFLQGELFSLSEIHGYLGISYGMLSEMVDEIEPKISCLKKSVVSFLKAIDLIPKDSEDPEILCKRSFYNYNAGVAYHKLGMTLKNSDKNPSNCFENASSCFGKAGYSYNSVSHFIEPKK